MRILIVLLTLTAFSASSFAATHRRTHSSSRLHAKSTTKTTAKSTSRAKGKSKSRGKTRRGTTARSYRTLQNAPTADRYKQIQQALAEKGYYKGAVNGEWGADSVDALRRFQADQNLEPDGKIGSLSLIALGLGPKRLSAQAKPDAKQPDPQPQPKQLNQ